MTSEILQPGTVVADRYRIDRLIGSGGFARVYRATELALDRSVALKILSTKVAETAERSPVRERFMREAQLLSQLRDPRTITMYGYDSTDDGLLYMALEYVDGVDLRVLLQTEGALPPDRIERLLGQVLLGLREAHVLNCLHRDIKPSNIMVYDRFGETDCVKLLDFGIAKAVLAEHKLGEDLTREGGIIGTPGYMSPEQLMGRPLTPASDLFSLGVVTYEMYAGRSPYPSRDATEIYRRIQSFDEDLGEMENAPEPLRGLCRRMLHPDPGQRVSSAEELLALLGEGPNARTQVVTEDAPIDVEMPDPGGTLSGADLHRARPSASVTFPLGLDPQGNTPPTELTTIGDRRMTARRAPTISRPVAEPEPDESRPPEERRGWVAGFAVLVAVILAAVVATTVSSPPDEDRSATAVSSAVVPSPDESPRQPASAATTNRDDETTTPTAPRIAPEVIEALARARANVELGAKLGIRDAADEADALASATAESSSAKKRHRTTARKRSRPEDEKPDSSTSDDSFKIVPFE